MKLNIFQGIGEKLKKICLQSIQKKPDKTGADVLAEQIAKRENTTWRWIVAASASSADGLDSETAKIYHKIQIHKAKNASLKDLIEQDENKINQEKT